MLSFTTLLADRDRYGDGDGKGFFFLLFLLLIGFGVFALIRAIRRRRGTWPEPNQGAGARRVLDERFARGEIDRAEYEHRKAVLDGADVIPPAPAAPPAAGPAAATGTTGTTATMAPPTPDVAADAVIATGIDSDIDSDTADGARSESSPDPGTGPNDTGSSDDTGPSDESGR